MQPWSLENPTHPTNADALVNCVTEIAMGFRAMTELASNSEPKARERLWDTALSVIRQMSVSIRKLCLDEQGASLRRAVGNPTMHPLGGAKGRYRKVTVTWKVPVRRERRVLSVGEIPTRQLSFQPVAIGTVVEETKRLKLPV